MAYRRYSNRGKHRDAGHQAAIRHIQEADAFAKEVGGTDQDVKNYFFNLSIEARRQIFIEYGRKYGSEKRDYAENAFESWRSGRVKMSGLVAKRLFDFLPPRMPVAARFKLVESLWKVFRINKKAYCVYGPQTSPSQVGIRLKEFFDQNAKGHDIPSNFKARFQWLSNGDASVYQELLNHYLELDRRRAAQAAEKTAEVLVNAFRNQRVASQLKQFTQTLEVDGCVVKLTVDKTSSDIVITRDEPNRKFNLHESMGCLVPIIIIIAIIIMNNT